MDETPYEKFTKQREKSEQENSRRNIEGLIEEGKKKRDTEKKLDTIISQNNHNKNSNKDTYPKKIIIGVVIGVILLILKFLLGL